MYAIKPVGTMIFFMAKNGKHHRGQIIEVKRDHYRVLACCCLWNVSFDLVEQI